MASGHAADATRSRRPRSHVDARGVAECVAPGAPIAVALSGGRDSVTLLDALLAAAAGARSRVAAVHVHHGLSPDADAWERFCVDLCRARGVPCRRAPRRPCRGARRPASRARRGACATPRSHAALAARGAASWRSRISATTRPRRCCCSYCAVRVPAAWRRCCAARGSARRRLVAAAAGRVARGHRRLRARARHSPGSTTRATRAHAASPQCGAPPRASRRWPLRVFPPPRPRSRARPATRPKPHAHRRRPGRAGCRRRLRRLLPATAARWPRSRRTAGATSCAGSCASAGCRASDGAARRDAGAVARRRGADAGVGHRARRARARPASRTRARARAAARAVRPCLGRRARIALPHGTLACVRADGSGHRRASALAVRRCTSARAPAASASSSPPTGPAAR